MQPLNSFGRRIFRFLVPGLVIPMVGLVTSGAGCIERPTTIDSPPERPFAGRTITVAGAGPKDALFLQQMTRSWSARSGMDVRIADSPWDGGADIGLIPPADLARWAEPGLLAELPVEFKSPTHPYRWDDVLEAYAVRLTSWRDRTYAVPITAEGMVLVYRKELFESKNGGPSGPPGTWDQLLRTAQRLGPGSLPPLPADAERLGAEFFSAVACYDRPAVGRIGAGELIRDEFFAFQFDPSTGDPRLNAMAFQHAAELFRGMREYRSTATDAAAAFRSGGAKVGVLSLTELGQLGPEVAETLGVAPLPGAEFTFDADGSKRPMDQGTINRVPYVGWGGRVGVVSAKCADPAAAWSLLIEAGIPDRAALDLVADPRWGAGPYRTSQLESRSRPRWFSYGLTAAETDRLVTALRDNLGPGVQNYRVRLRTPNQDELAAALDQELRKILSGSSPADLTAANERWKKIIGKQPPKEWKELARKSLGL